MAWGLQRTIKLKPLLVELAVLMSPWIMGFIVRDIANVLNHKDCLTPFFYKYYLNVCKELVGVNWISYAVGNIVLGLYVGVAVVTLLYLMIFYSFCIHESVTPKWDVLRKFICQLI